MTVYLFWLWEINKSIHSWIKENGFQCRDCKNRKLVKYSNIKKQTCLAVSARFRAGNTLLNITIYWKLVFIPCKGSLSRYSELICETRSCFPRSGTAHMAVSRPTSVELSSTRMKKVFQHLKYECKNFSVIQCKLKVLISHNGNLKNVWVAKYWGLIECSLPSRWGQKPVVP